MVFKNKKKITHNHKINTFIASLTTQNAQKNVFKFTNSIKNNNINSLYTHYLLTVTSAKY